MKHIPVFFLTTIFLICSCSTTAGPTNIASSSEWKSPVLGNCKFISSRLGMRAIICDDHTIILGGVRSTPENLLSTLERGYSEQKTSFRKTTLQLNSKTVNALYTWSGSEAEPFMSIYDLALNSPRSDISFLVYCYRTGGKIASKSQCESIISEFLKRDGFKRWPSELPLQHPSSWLIPIPFIKLRAPSPCGIISPKNYQCNDGQVSWEVFDKLEDANKMLEVFKIRAPEVTVGTKEMPCTIGGVKTTCIYKHMSASVPIVAYYATITIGDQSLFIACSVRPTMIRKAPGPICGSLIKFQ